MPILPSGRYGKRSKPVRCAKAPLTRFGSVLRGTMRPYELHLWQLHCKTLPSAPGAPVRDLRSFRAPASPAGIRLSSLRENSVPAPFPGKQSRRFAAPPPYLCPGTTTASGSYSQSRRWPGHLHPSVPRKCCRPTAHQPRCPHDPKNKGFYKRVVNIFSLLIYLSYKYKQVFTTSKTIIPARPGPP